MRSWGRGDGKVHATGHSGLLFRRWHGGGGEIAMMSMMIMMLLIEYNMIL